MVSAIASRHRIARDANGFHLRDLNLLDAEALSAPEEQSRSMMRIRTAEKPKARPRYSLASERNELARLEV